MDSLSITSNGFRPFVDNNIYRLLCVAQNDEIGRRILSATKGQGMSQTQLAKRVGISVGSLNLYVLGKRRIPPEYLSRIADELGVTTDHLISGASRRKSNVEPSQLPNAPTLTLVPYWGTVPAGNWERPDVDDEVKIEVSDQLSGEKEIVCFTITGDSMSPRLTHGQKVVIKLSKQPRDGVITLAKNQNGEITLKVLKYKPEGWFLEPINRDSGPVDPVESWEIIGYAMHVEETSVSGLRP